MAALFVLDGEGPLLVVEPEPEPELLVAELEDLVAADVDDWDRVAMLMVVFLANVVPVAAAPLPTAPVPTATVVAGTVVVALAEPPVVPLLLEPPATTPPDAELVGTEELDEPVELAEARAETALVGPLV